MANLGKIERCFFELFHCLRYWFLAIIASLIYLGSWVWKNYYPFSMIENWFFACIMVVLLYILLTKVFTWRFGGTLQLCGALFLVLVAFGEPQLMKVSILLFSAGLVWQFCNIGFNDAPRMYLREELGKFIIKCLKRKQKSGTRRNNRRISR